MGFDLLIIGELALIAVVAMYLGKLVHSLVLQVTKRLTANTKTTLDDLVLQYIESPLKAVVIVLAVFLIADFVPNLGEVRQLMTKYAMGIIILLSAYIISEIVGAILKWYYLEGQKETNAKLDLTLVPFLRNASRIAIMFFGITTSLATIGIDISGILTVGTVAALVLGLASQESLANIFAGLALQLDRPYLYKDYLKLVTGEVVKLRKIGLRSTKLDDLHGSTMVISNSEFAKQRIVNLSKPGSEFKIDLVVELPIGANLEKFESHIKSKTKELEKTHGIRGISVKIQKVGEKTCEAVVSYWIGNYQQAGDSKDLINRASLEFISKK
ncbi:mechanosensitive ion channel family protein [Candidatus Micrarchaeota archaeon]|nr:mechanosensitive ion channel family protein [Candidatus Micrarchaeota archaeon]